jgi:hypothetical protein
MTEKPANQKGGELAPAHSGKVLQVERHDFPDLAPQNAKRTQADARV